MKVAVLLALAFLLSPTLITAQTQVADRPTRPAVGGRETVLLNGKVITEDNSPPPESVTVALECAGTQLSQVNTDPSGHFSITVRHSNGPKTANFPQAPDFDGTEPTDLASCELMARLSGYSSGPLRLSGQSANIGVSNVGTIVLHSSGQAQAFVVTVSSLAAPDKAKAAFAKGEEQKNKGKWSAAMDSFRKAIAVYPRYALAWLELGRVQATQHNFADAQQSFRQSVTQDSKFVAGYVELAHLAAQQSEWQDLLSASERLVQMHPEIAEFWFWNAAANFNLGNIKQAESGITRGLRIDSAHRVPQMEYLYALVLARQQNFQSAAEHTAAYLNLLPTAIDAPEAQKRLAELQKLATASATK